VLSDVFVFNLINFANINSHGWCFKNGKFLAIKSIAKKLTIFWIRGIFGNICQIWQHLATLTTGWAIATNHAERAFPSCVETTAR